MRTRKTTEFTAYFLIERTTKGAVRYMETAGPDDDTPVTIVGGAKVGTFYARKSAFTGRFPRRLILHVRRRKRSR
jgi:hypothetical protein